MSLSGIWTAKGIDKLATQTVGGPTLTIHKIALGDGGGIVPAVAPSQVALLKEVWRGLVNAVLVEPDTPNAVTVEAVIPYSVGGFYIREWGIYDTDGDLIAVGPHAEFYKPLLAEGSGAELLERIQLPLSNAGQVNLTISSEALATRKYVDQTATAKAREEVARHDGEDNAHGGRIDELLKRNISAASPLTGGGNLTANRTLGINAAAAATANFVILRDAAGRAQVAAPAAAADIARKAEVDAVRAEKYDLAQYYWFEDDMPRAGFFSCLGGVVTNFAAKYPQAAVYFNGIYGKKRLVTQAQYDALHVAVWHTCADGTKIGWNGIGGVNKFVWDKAADTLRLPDLAGMTHEAIGYASLGVGRGKT